MPWDMALQTLMELNGFQVRRERLWGSSTVNTKREQQIVQQASQPLTTQTVQVQLYERVGHCRYHQDAPVARLPQNHYDHDDRTPSPATGGLVTAAPVTDAGSGVQQPQQPRQQIVTTGFEQQLRRSAAGG